MKKLGIVIVIGVCLSLGFYSGACYARGGGGHGGGHGGGFHGGGFHGGFHGGHSHHFGGTRVFIGGSFGFPYYYPYGYYPYPYYGYPYAYPYPAYYSDPYAAIADTPLVVPSEPQQSYWYYCQDAQGYYPYVKSCPGGWTQVVPTPPEPGKEGAAQ